MTSDALYAWHCSECGPGRASTELDAGHRYRQSREIAGAPAPALAVSPAPYGFGRLARLRRVGGVGLGSLEGVVLGGQTRKV